MPVVICLFFCIQASAAHGATRKSTPKPKTEVCQPKHDDYIDDLDPQFVDCWPADRMPLRIYIESVKNALGSKDDYLDYLLKQSCQEWADASKGKISFVYTDKPEEADIQINWENDESIFTTGEQGDAQYLPTTEKGINKATVRLLTHPFSRNPDHDDAAIKALCLHEMGHALGLYGHSKNSHDILAEYYQLEWTDTPTTVLLSKRDCNTIARLYTEFLSIKAHWKAEGKLGNVQAKDTFSLNNSAVEAIKKENFPQAVDQLQRALALDPDYRLALINLETAYLNWAIKCEQTGEYEKAVDLAKKDLIVRKKLYGNSDPRRAQITRECIYLMRKCNQTAEADKWQAELTNTNKATDHARH